jgi:hypothetical protein
MGGDAPPPSKICPWQWQTQISCKIVRIMKIGVRKQTIISKWNWLWTYCVEYFYCFLTRVFEYNFDNDNILFILYFISLTLILGGVCQYWTGWFISDKICLCTSLFTSCGEIYNRCFLACCSIFDLVPPFGNRCFILLKKILPYYVNIYSVSV